MRKLATLPLLAVLCVGLVFGAQSNTQRTPAKRTTTAKPAAKKPAAAPKTSSKKPTSAGKSTSARSTAKRTPAKTSSKKTRSTRSKSRRQAGWRSGQMQPEPERYTEIQQALIDKGYGAGSGSADGRWGPDWTEALKRFQRDQNLDASGKLTSLSLMALGLGPRREASGAAAPAPPETSTDPGTQPDTTNRESQ